jgi:tetratricopeptide (TPR) repeat protein
MNRFDYLWLKWRAMGLLVLGRNAAALALFDAMLQRWPDDAYALASRMHLRAQAGQTNAALADSRHLVMLRSDHAHTWFNHGYVLELAGLWEEALAAFKRASELGPEAGPCLVRHGPGADPPSAL